MKVILVLAAALSSVSVSAQAKPDKVQRQLGKLAEEIATAKFGTGPTARFVRASVEWRSIVIDLASFNELTEEQRDRFFEFTEGGMGLCGADNVEWMKANDISFVFRVTSPEGNTLSQTAKMRDCGKLLQSTRRPPVDNQGREYFSFKGVVAGRKVNPSYLRDCAVQRGDIETTCKTIDGSIGNYATLPPSMLLYDGRLTFMTGLFDRAAFLHIYRAFLSRYGQPCDTSTEKWRNAAGAVLNNSVVTWCFSTGKLELKEISDSLNYGHWSYRDEFQAPARQLPRNF